MVCHDICEADDMTDVTIWQNFRPVPALPPDLREPYRT